LSATYYYILNRLLDHNIEDIIYLSSVIVIFKDLGKLEASGVLFYEQFDNFVLELYKRKLHAF